jgi:hypothetical protein
MRETMITARRREPCEQCGQRETVNWDPECQAYLCHACSQEMADRDRWEVETSVDATT